MQAKYVIVEHCRPYLFPLSVRHSTAQKLGQITSAAFVSIKPVYSPALMSIKLDFQVYGRSTSLNIGPSDDDVFLLETYFTFLSQGGKNDAESP